MRKKLLFAAMTLAALTACTDNDFESQKMAEQTDLVSPVKFEVINDAVTRASMNGNTVSWNVNDKDLFTLYHGATAAGAVTGYENATYTATPVEGSPATLTTPSMIKEGWAIMVWPVDTNFRIKPADALSLTIPAVQGGKVKVGETEKETIQNQIPYVSDQIKIDAYAVYNKDVVATYTNTAGKDRKYPVYMRPMASQLNLNAEYAGTDAEIATLYKGGSEGLSDDEAIDPIKVTSVDLLTKAGGTTLFTTEIKLKFDNPTPAIGTQWLAKEPLNAWEKVTAFDAVAASTNKLTTKCLQGNNSCKFLILPQAAIGDGVEEGAVVVNTIYGKVVVAKKGVADTKYVDGEWEDAWWRFIKPATAGEAYETKAATAETSGTYAGKHKTTASPANGLMQTINVFSTFVGPDGSTVKGEPMGTSAPRFVKVLLTHLDMTDLHIKNDKQLRDVVRVWKKLGLDPVTVYLDGDDNEEFALSQKTIKVINDINGDGAPQFKVKPCRTKGEKCSTIVITGASDIQDVQNMAFIVKHQGGFNATVAFANETTAWKWNGAVKVTDNGGKGVDHLVNRGIMVNTTGATLKTTEYDGTQNNVLLVNDGTWTISGGELIVQFDVTNNGTVTIAAGAEYLQAKGSANTTFINQATAKPTRFGGDDTKIGVVHNSGVFATLAATGSVINNYGEIYHDAKAAKTYITSNQTATVNFANAFADPANKMGWIILPYDNKDEDNISVKADLDEGFVAVRIDASNAPTDGILNETAVGPRVNYIKIDGGITTVSDMPASIKYVEFNSGTTEIDWTVTTAQTYDGMMVLSPVNIKLGTTITVNKATYLGANMYVGGTFVKGSWSGYFGDTSANEATKYRTF